MAEKLIPIGPKIDKLRAQRDEIREEMNKISEIINGKYAEIDKVKQEDSVQREQRSDVKQQLDKFQADIDKIKEQIQELQDKKYETKEAYYKEKYEYDLERAEISQIEWMAKEKQRIIDQEQYKQKKIEERKQSLADRDNPFKREIETCDHLIALCSKMMVQFGLAQNPNETTLDVQKQLLN